MVKRQREKQHQSTGQQSASVSSTSPVTGSSASQRRLPFSHCALSLTAFETPVSNRDGIVFENSALLPFIMKHKMDPVTGNQMSTRDVIKLNIDKDEEGRWQCPVLTKPFADHTKIIAVLQPPSRNEANVFSYEAYHELNVKAKNYEDLISGVKFDRNKDVLVLNDPNDDDLNRRRDINRFYHVLHAREFKDNDESKKSDIRQSVTATRILEKLQKDKQAKESAAKPPSNAKSPPNQEEATTFIAIDGSNVPILAADVTGVQYTSGQVASSFTSTSTAVAHDNLQRQATAEEVRKAQFQVMRKAKKKGYVRLRTSHGNFTMELHCDIVPRTCTNFLGLCRAGRYDGTTFHRLIKSFMIQGGKAVDGSDESLWSGAFEDEFDDRLKHSGGGILSMANAGPGTNRQQFFITFKSCPHLDRKHSVFGQVVEGIEALKALENISTDKKERPIDEIKIIGTDMIKDPSLEAKEAELVRIEKVVRKRVNGKQKSSRGSGEKTTVAPRAKVGKYLKNKLEDKASLQNSSTRGEMAPSRLPPPPKKTKFGDFSGW